MQNYEKIKISSILYNLNSNSSVLAQLAVSLDQIYYVFYGFFSYSSHVLIFSTVIREAEISIFKSLILLTTSCTPNSVYVEKYYQTGVDYRCYLGIASRPLFDSISTQRQKQAPGSSKYFFLKPAKTNNQHCQFILLIKRTINQK